ncbi:hypothetical protein BVG81_000840 [Haliangium sp. UPWRP_2]|nr:hypothetical protein BVG81_000840 [Haliangium sp. UPWRP_2]
MSRKGEPGAQESWGKTLDYADKCIASGAIDPGGSEYGSAEEIRVIKSQAESHVGPSTQPAYRRDVKLSVVFGVAGLAMLLGGAISYAVLERQPFMLKMSDCMPSSGFRDEACGTRLYGLTGSLMGVGSAAVAVAVGFGIKLVSSPKSYLPKDTPTPEDAAARGGAR